jgi:dihydroxyacetone kinase-like predicted kinase
MPQVVDARVLRDAMARYLEALRAHREEIDSLNVFPVPDGDTGTNMLLTQRVVPTGSVPEGLAVATAVVPDDVPEKNVSRARDAAVVVASGRALRGQVVGAVRAIHLDHHEIATLIAGRDVSDEEAEAEAAAVRETFPSLEVEWHRGGQVDPPFLIGIE